MAGHRITHVSPHGALGNMALADRATAEILVRAVRAFDPRLAMLVLSNSELARAADAAGLPSHALFLADRAYDSSGQLVPRRLPGALVTSEPEILARVERVLAEGCVVSAQGDIVQVAAESILVHGDTPGAVAIARAIRRRIEDAGGEVVPLSALRAS
jgi:UPF0271 protein